MEDLSVVLKKSLLEQMYKKKTETFGTVKERVDKMNEQRKNIRQDVIFEKRRIPANLTPISSPLIKCEKINKKEKSPKKNDKPIVNKRLEMLAKWKAEKEKKKLEQKKSQKPVFKVTHIPVQVGLPNLETVNKEIKGKPFKSKFAPPNHKFKPPPNIRPISFQEVKPKIEKSNKSQIITRSQSQNLNKLSTSSSISDNNDTKKQARSEKGTKTEIANKVDELKVEKLKEKTKRGKTVKIVVDKEKKIESQKVEEGKKVGRRRKSSVSVENKENEGKPEGGKNNVHQLIEKTPEKKLSDPPVYVSPFVTVSRGKNSARKEYVARKSRQSFSTKTNVSDCTSPSAGAAYFTWRLNNQINRFQELCNHWNKYKEEENPPEEAISMIDVTIGQTNLLLTKKFVQFRSLIDHCKNQDAETPVTCEDLHGFWDMMHIQIVNLDKRFENLDQMKANNWQEIIPEPKKMPPKKRGRPPKAAKPSVGLMEAIREARIKKQSENLDINETENYPKGKTPENKRRSRVINMKSSEKHRNSSPGLMMMKIAQYAKGVETPVKSILKTDNQKSVKSQSKTVLFEDKDNQVDVRNIENNLNVSNSKTQDRSKNSPRRSSRRLSKTKLF